MALGPNDQLIAKWRDHYAQGGHPHEAVLWLEDLRPDTFLADHSCVVNSPAGSGSNLVFLDSPADFLAWLRWAALPFALSQAAGNSVGSVQRSRPASGERAEAYFDLLAGRTDVILRECLAVMDEILSQDEINRDDAKRAIAAYNQLFELGDFDGCYESTFYAWDSMDDYLRDYSQDYEDVTEEEFEEWRHTMHDSDLVQCALQRLFGSGTFDLHKPEHLRVARDALWCVQAWNELEPGEAPDWESYRQARPGG